MRKLVLFAIVALGCYGAYRSSDLERTRWKATRDVNVRAAPGGDIVGVLLEGESLAMSSSAVGDWVSVKGDLVGDDGVPYSGEWWVHSSCVEPCLEGWRKVVSYGSWIVVGIFVLFLFSLGGSGDSAGGSAAVSGAVRTVSTSGGTSSSGWNSCQTSSASAASKPETVQRVVNNEWWAKLPFATDVSPGSFHNCKEICPKCGQYPGGGGQVGITSHFACAPVIQCGRCKTQYISSAYYRDNCYAKYR